MPVRRPITSYVGTPKRIIGERVDLAGENTDKVRELLRDLGQWRETVGAAIPQKPNPLYDALTESDEFDWPYI